MKKFLALVLTIISSHLATAQTTTFSVTANPSTISCGSSSTLSVFDIKASFSNVQVHYFSREFVIEFPDDDCSIEESSLYFGKIGSKYYYLGTARPTNGASFSGSYRFGNTINDLVGSTEVECNGDDYTIRETYEGGLSIFVNIEMSYQSSEASISWSDGLGSGSPKTVSPVVNTTYSVTINPDGSATSLTKSITVNVSGGGCEAPVIGSFDGGSVVCQDASAGVKLYTNPSGYADYKWYRNGVEITGARGAQQYVALEEGSYQVSVDLGGGNFSILSDPFLVTEIEPSISISGTGSACEYLDLSATFSGQSDFTYQIYWYHNSQFVGVGDTHRAEVSGTYFATLFVEIGVCYFDTFQQSDVAPNFCSCTSCSCPANSDSIEVEIIDSANAGPDGSTCRLEYPLEGSGEVNEGVWSKISGPGGAVNFNNINDPISTVTVSNYGTYGFRWTLNDNTCSPNFDVVNITFEQLLADAGLDDQSCNLSYRLSGSDPLGGVGTWRKLSGPGSLSFSDINDRNSTVVASVSGVYNLEWSISGAECEVAPDIVQIDFKGIDFDIFIDNSCPTLGDPVILNIVGGNPAIGWNIEWGDGTIESTNSTYLEHYYAKGEYTITVSVDYFGCSATRSSETIVLSLCTSDISEEDTGTGRFKMDKLTGGLFYERDDCSIDIPFNCLVGPPIEIPRVITASTSTVTDKWPSQGEYYQSGEDLPSANIYETALRGKWRRQDTYTYNTADIQRDRNFNTGTYGLNVFNRQNISAKLPAWIRSSRVTRYSPNGDALEEVNALDIRSAAKFGYYGAVPYLTAQNASYNTVLFESFETDYSGRLESGLESSANSTDAFPGLLTSGHSGSASVVLPGATDGLHLKTPLLIMNSTSNEIIVQAWVKGIDSNLNVDLYSETGTLISSNNWPILSRSGEWALASVAISVGISKYSLRLYYSGSPMPGAAMDDIRVQPLDAEMNCYVYDPKTLRLLTVFDDQHFGLYYQYNEEGKLIRKKIETERGIKTIQETFYNSFNE
ncbi:MAG: hypothetical protein AAGF85_06770 [Bacteroidota bacterium]